MYLRDGSAQTSLRATTLRQKLQMEKERERGGGGGGGRGEGG